MTVIPKQSLDFLKTAAPFDLLEDADLHEVAKGITIAYLTPENARQIIQEQGACLFLISSGQFSVKDSNGPQRHLSEGDYFGFGNLIDKLGISIEIEVESAGLLYCINGQQFEQCMEHYPEFARFFETSNTESLQNQAVNDSKSIWLYRKIEEVIKREAICADYQLQTVDAIKIMAKEKVSSLLITRQQSLVGIVTDRDVRNRIVAEEFDTHLPISEVMTTEPFSIGGHKDPV